VATKSVQEVIEEMREQIKALSERLAVLEAGGPVKKKRISPSSKQEPSSVSKIRDAFLGSFLKAHGHEYPGWGARENGQAANWLRSIQVEKAVAYATVFPHWKNKRMVTRGHTFSDLIVNYVELDAHMNRHMKIVSDIAGAAVMEKFLITNAIEQQEVVEHAKRAANPDHIPASIAYDHKVQIQTRSELHRTLNERDAGSDRENASKRDGVLLQDRTLGDPEEV